MAKTFPFSNVDTYRKKVGTGCGYLEKLTGSDSKLEEAKYLCSKDLSCNQIFVWKEHQDRGTYHKCGSGSITDYDYDSPYYTIYVKGKF